MEIDRFSATPPWRQLADWLREQIVTGQIPAGRAIPSKKQLTQEFGVAAATVDKAVKLLKEEGLVGAVHGLGIFVLEREG